MPVVRISKGKFDVANAVEAERCLAGVTFERITNHEILWTIAP
jgi:hypothetical protein